MRAVNLIPADARRGGGAGRAGRSGGMAHVLVGALAVLLVLVGVWTLAGRDLTNARTELAQLEQRTADAQRRAAPLAAFQALAVTGAQRIATVKSLAEARFDWSATLGAIARILPIDVRLDSLTGTMVPPVVPAAAPVIPADGAPAPAAPVPAAPAPAPSIKLTGCAPSLARVARLVPRMQVVPGVGDVLLGPATVPPPAERDSATSGVVAPTEGCDRVSFELTLTFVAETPPAATAPVVASVPAPVPGASR